MAPSATPAHSAILALKAKMAESIIGQEGMIERLLLGLLADGHLLVEGLPGLAKTRAIKALARHLDAKLSRIQFTPDLLPADLTGSDIFDNSPGSSAGSGTFRFQEGPLFANLVLADEVNRAPAKVQAALLEAMEERQVTIGGHTHKLPPLFLVMATENPIEQEGTYPLPEAQLDRFLMHVRVDYPDEASEAKIIALVRSEEAPRTATPEGSPAAPPAPAADVVAQQTIFDARAEVHAVTVSDAVAKYIVTLVTATRSPKKFDDTLAGWLQVGASPRAGIGLDKVSRAYAWLQGRTYVTPADVQAIAHDVLRHRLILTYDALASGVTPDQAIDTILKKVAVA